MEKRRAARFALTLILSVMVVFGLLWARWAARSTSAEFYAIGPPALLEVKLLRLLAAGDAANALRALDTADSLEPDLSWWHALALRRQMQRVDPLLAHAGRKAHELLARLPEVPPAPEYSALAVPPGLTPEIAYLRGLESDRAFGQVFADLAALLGKRAESLPSGDVARAAGRPTVLAPGVKLGTVPAQRVVALAPEPTLEAALGLTKPAPKRMERCVLGSTHPDLQVLQATALQLPVEGVRHEYARASSTAQVVAMLSCADGEHPGLFRLERSGSEPAYMFAFNVLESIVLTRQGDPANKGQENDGVRGRRPSDLFVRDLSPAQLQMPFSDLLMETLLELVEGDQPSLRLWHNPARRRGVLIVTSDQDYVGEDRLAIMVAALAQWQAHATFYLTSGTYQANGEQGVTEPTPAFVNSARVHGMSIAAHTFLLDVHKPAEDIVAEHVHELRSTYAQPPTSNRFHLVRWLGYTELPAVLARAGYRFDTSYLTLNSKHIGGLGYMTGAGLPLPYYTEHGESLQIRQLATQIDDHAHPVFDTGLRSEGKPLTMERDALVAVTKGLVEAAGRRYHSPVVVNNHPLQFAEDPDWLRMLIETARVEQLSVLDVERYGAFVSALTDSIIARVAGETGFRVLIQAAEQDLVVRNYARDSILIDGRAQPLRVVTLFDRPAKVVSLSRGMHTVSLP